jgi:phosphoribosylglycinamide formyltransferase 1
MARLAVLVSGTGSLLEAMIAGRLPIALVLADRTCRGLDIAQAAGLPTAVIDRRRFGFRLRAPWDREGFTAAVTQALQDRHIALVALSGFMTVFAPSIFEPYAGRILNTHPALLPDFKGGHAVADALAAGVAATGCTVHLATPELDSGTILAQAKVPILPGDTVDILWERIKQVERKLYPQVINNYLRSLANQSVD